MQLLGGVGIFLYAISSSANPCRWWPGERLRNIIACLRKRRSGRFFGYGCHHGHSEQQRDHRHDGELRGRRSHESYPGHRRHHGRQHRHHGHGTDSGLPGQGSGVSVRHRGRAAHLRLPVKEAQASGRRPARLRTALHRHADHGKFHGLSARQAGSFPRLQQQSAARPCRRHAAHAACAVEFRHGGPDHRPRHAGTHSLEAAIPIIFGDNIGTTVTAVLAALGTGRAARQACAAHVLFNVIGVCIWMPGSCLCGSASSKRRPRPSGIR